MKSKEISWMQACVVQSGQELVWALWDAGREVKVARWHEPMR